MPETRSAARWPPSTWLSWWRSALVATGGVLAVRRVTPRLLHVAAWPYVLLGVGDAGVAIGLLVAGAYRHRSLQRAVETDAVSMLDFKLVTAFTIARTLLALCTIALVLAQT